MRALFVTAFFLFICCLCFSQSSEGSNPAPRLAPSGNDAYSGSNIDQKKNTVPASPKLAASGKEENPNGETDKTFILPPPKPAPFSSDKIEAEKPK